MNYLVDTHIFLWALLSPKRISKKVRDILTRPGPGKYVSIITFWEIALKFSKKKIDLEKYLPEDMPQIAKNTGFEILNLDANVASSYYKLPMLKHKDPFDGMIIWQAVKEGYVLASRDKEFSEYEKYGLKLIW